MTTKYSFRTFDPLLHDAPQTCGMCHDNRPVFQFETHQEQAEEEGQESRWNTLRALRVLDWARGGVR